MTDKEAMKLALFALDIVKIHYTQSRHINEAIAALKERLAQPEQEPTAKYSDIVSDGGLDPRNKFDAQVQRTEQEPVLYDTQFSEQERKEIAARGFVPFEFNRIVPPTQPPQRTEQEPVAWNKNIRDKVDSLLAKAGYQPDSSIRNALSCMNFDNPPQRTWVGLTDDFLQKIISNLEPLLDAKNQSWSQAEKMLIGILGEQPPQRTEQEPVAWEQFYTTPPQRTWVGLTVEEIADCCRESTTTQLSFYNVIEAKLKQKNTPQRTEEKNND